MPNDTFCSSRRSCRKTLAHHRPRQPARAPSLRRHDWVPPDWHCSSPKPGPALTACAWTALYDLLNGTSLCALDRPSSQVAASLQAQPVQSVLDCEYPLSGLGVPTDRTTATLNLAHYPRNCRYKIWTFLAHTPPAAVTHKGPSGERISGFDRFRYGTLQSIVPAPPILTSTLPRSRVLRIQVAGERPHLIGTR
jgi:hypothetical protein